MSFNEFFHFKSEELIGTHCMSIELPIRYHVMDMEAVLAVYRKRMEDKKEVILANFSSLKEY